MRRFVLAGFVGFFLLLLSETQVLADNLLLNSSFETITSAVPDSWTKNVSTATVATSTTIKSGSASASINKTNSSTGTIYIYQDVDIEAGSYYSLTGWVVKNDSNFSYVILRISWRDSGSEISKTDSSQLTSNSTDFQELTISSVQAPSSSVKARIELLANISTVNPTNPALFDDISFSQVSAPEQPTSTPAPAVTATATPTAAPSASPTAIPTKKPTAKPSPSPSLGASPTPDEAPEIVLAATSETTPEPTPAQMEASPSGMSKFLGKNLVGIIFSVLGTGFLGVAGYSFFKGKSSDTIIS